MSTETMDLRERLIAEFDLLESRLNGKSALPLYRLRRQAMEEFRRLGFPGTRNEEWKYTNIMPLTKQSFKPVLTRHTSSLTREDIQPFLFDTDATVMVFVNGFFTPELSTKREVNDPVAVLSLAEAQHIHSEIVDQHIARYAGYQHSSFTALNTALAQDGAFVMVPENGTPGPLHLLFLTDTREGAVFGQPRNLILLGENSQTTLIESYGTIGNDRSLTNSVSEIVLDAHARLDHYIIQNDSENASAVGTTQVHQERESTYSSTTITLGGQLIRNNLSACLNGERTETHFYGLYLLKDEQHVDNHTLVDHAKPNCNSNELYKGIVDGKSTGVFNGKIMVRQDAQKTNAFQSNRNILLSDNASVNTKPQLEIFADDVKCSHGATSGQLDEEALFYLRSRGLDKTQAQAFLTFAFAEEIIETIKIESLRKQLEQSVAERLHSEV